MSKLLSPKNHKRKTSDSPLNKLPPSKKQEIFILITEIKQVEHPEDLKEKLNLLEKYLSFLVEDRYLTFRSANNILTDALKALHHD